jgi:hypothetical protein
MAGGGNTSALLGHQIHQSILAAGGQSDLKLKNSKRNPGDMMGSPIR